MFAGGKGAELKAVGRTDAAAQIRAVKRDRGGLKDLAQVERGAGEVLSNGKACLVAESACLAGEFGAGKIVQVVKLDGLAKGRVRGIGAGRGKGDVPGPSTRVTSRSASEPPRSSAAGASVPSTTMQLS